MEKEILKDSERTKCEIWSRVMGYLRPRSEYNIGKRLNMKVVNLLKNLLSYLKVNSRRLKMCDNYGQLMLQYTSTFGQEYSATYPNIKEDEPTCTDLVRDFADFLKGQGFLTCNIIEALQDVADDLTENVEFEYKTLNMEEKDGR